MKSSIPQSVVVEQLQNEIGRFINRTASPDIGGARTQCASSVELNRDDSCIRVSVEMEYAVDEITLAEMLKFKAAPVDVNSVEEGV